MRSYRFPCWTYSAVLIHYNITSSSQWVFQPLDNLKHAGVIWESFNITNISFSLLAPNHHSLLGLMCTCAFSQTLIINTRDKTPKTCSVYYISGPAWFKTNRHNDEALRQMQSAHNTPSTIFLTNCYERREAFESCTQRREQSRVFLCADAERWGEMGEMRHWSVLISCLLSRYSHTHTHTCSTTQEHHQLQSRQ